MLRKTLMSSAVAVSLWAIPASAATLSGVVKDSLDATKPVANAVVSLRRGASQQVYLRDTTDATGAYSFSDVADSSYTIRVTATGYVAKTSSTITVSGANQTVNFDLVPIVYGKVAGTITDAAGSSPISGAIVTLRVGTQTRATDTVGADGKYQFDSVASGTYSVRAVAATYTTSTTDSVIVSGSATKTVDIALAKIVYGTVSGTVTDSATPSTKIAQAVVTLRVGGQIRDTDTTDADGAYQFDSVVAGTYSVRVAASTYLTETVDSVVVSGTAPITVNVALVKILYATISGTVTDSGPTPAPLGGAVVTLQAAGGIGGTRRDTTDAQGNYSFDSVSTGTYTLAAVDSGYARRTVVVTAAGASQTIDFKLLTIQISSLAGVVTDSGTTQPVSGAVVSLRLGNSTVIRDTTGTDGTYSFASVETGDYILRVEMMGYTTKNVQFYARGTAAASVNVDLAARSATQIVSQRSANAGARRIDISRGKMVLNGFASRGVVTIYNMNGRVAFKAAFAGPRTEVDLSAKIPAGRYVAEVRTNFTRLVQSFVQP